STTSSITSRISPVAWSACSSVRPTSVCGRGLCAIDRTLAFAVGESRALFDRFRCDRTVRSYFSSVLCAEFGAIGVFGALRIIFFRCSVVLRGKKTEDQQRPCSDRHDIVTNDLLTY